MAKVSKEQYNKFIQYKNYLDNQIYRHPIVSIEEFVTNPYYLGGAFSGGKTLYPCWRKTLKDIFISDDRYIVVLTGATSIGKTVGGIVGLLYVMYRHLEMKDIWKFYDMADGGKVAIAFFNLTKNLSSTAGFTTMQGYMCKSEYFKSRGILNSDKTKIDFPEIEFILASPNSSGYSTIGRHIIGAMVDEVDSPNANSTAQDKVLGAVNNTILRLEGRFLKNKKTPCRLFLCSSKQENATFLNIYINKMQETAGNSSKLYVADFKRWDALPSGDFCGERFQVSCGDAFNLPRIIRDDKDIKIANEKHHEIIDVPIEYRDAFELDLVKGIRDIAGMSVEALKKSRLFPNSQLINNCWDTSRENPVNIPTIDIGVDDTGNLIDFIDFSKFKVAKSVGRYIHCDIAFSQDALGLAMACVHGNKDIKKEMDDGTYKMVRVPCVHIDFVMRLKARDGDSIPLHKVRRLILDLKDKGFNIRKYTSDLVLASKDTFQLLNKAGIQAEYFSMDQPVTNYIQFRDLVIEGRVNCFPHSLLKVELTYLEHDRTGKGKVDHPKQIKDLQYLEDGDVTELVMDGSKDLSDSVAGASLTALEEGTNLMDVDGMMKVMGDLSRVDKPMETAMQNMMKVNGKQVIGTSQDGQLKKFNDLLRSLQ